MVLGQLGQIGVLVVQRVGMATNSEPEIVTILLQLMMATPVLDRAQKTSHASVLNVQVSKYKSNN